MVWYEAKEDER